MTLLLQNGRLLNHNGTFEKKDILIEGERIANVATDIAATGHEVIDCGGKLLVPGLVDVHVHLREPGGEHKETIETGTQAAAHGGFTTIAAMPNTSPVPDSPEEMKNIQQRCQSKANVRVLPYAAISKSQHGAALVDFSALANAGSFAFSDDGVGVQDAGMMLAAMKQAAAHEKAVVAHCEDQSLANNGYVHDGGFAAKQQIRGIPSVSESVQIARDVLLAEEAGAHYHVCHVSTKESVRILREAKRAGIHVTAEVTPHHLLLCEDDIVAPDSNYKMNPPLRAKEDREALIEGLLDGSIDLIATDHAPHAQEEKSLDMVQSPFGIVGLETAFPLLYTHLVQKGLLSLQKLVDLLTKKPCEAFDLPYGKILADMPADITVIDLENEQTITPNLFASKGKNTPFRNWSCQGWPVLTVVSGKIAYRYKTSV